MERDGYAVLRGVLTGEELASARAAITGVYEAQPPSGRARVQDEDFRYKMFNKCALAQWLVAHRRILDAIEPLGLPWVGLTTGRHGIGNAEGGDRRRLVEFAGDAIEGWDMWSAEQFQPTPP